MHAILPTDELRPRSKAAEVRLQDEGTHTGRTIMLDELRAVLASCRPGAGVDAKRQVNELRPYAPRRPRNSTRWAAHPRNPGTAQSRPLPIRTKTCRRRTTTRSRRCVSNRVDVEVARRRATSSLSMRAPTASGAGRRPPIARSLNSRATFHPTVTEAPSRHQRCYSRFCRPGQQGRGTNA